MIVLKEGERLSMSSLEAVEVVKEAIIVKVQQMLQGTFGIMLLCRCSYMFCVDKLVISCMHVPGGSLKALDHRICRINCYI